MIPPIKYNLAEPKLNELLQILHSSSLNEEEQTIVFGTVIAARKFIINDEPHLINLYFTQSLVPVIADLIFNTDLLEGNPSLLSHINNKISEKYPNHKDILIKGEQLIARISEIQPIFIQRLLSYLNLNSLNLENGIHVYFDKIQYKNPYSNYLQSLLIPFINPYQYNIFFNFSIGVGEIEMKIWEKNKNKKSFLGNKTATTTFYGNEANQNLATIAKLNFFINDIYNVHITNDADIYWHTVIHNKNVNVSFGNIDALPLIPFREMGRAGDTTYAHYIQLSLFSLTENGKSFILINYDFNDAKYKEQLLEKDLIETVILLPKTMISKANSLLIFNNKKSLSQKGKVLFVDLTTEKANISDLIGVYHKGWENINFDYTQVVSNADIFQNNCDLNPKIYLENYAKEYQQVFENNKEIIKPIRDCVFSYQKGKIQVTKTGVKKHHFVRISNLKAELYNYLLDISNVPELEIEENAVIIDYSAILISLLGNKLRPTYFLYEGIPLSIGENILALKMNEDIDIEYFIAQLYSRFVEIQLSLIATGTNIPRMNVEDFLNVNILLPPINEQRRAILEIRNTLDKQARLNFVEQKIETETRKLEHDIIAIVSHNLNQKLGSIVNDVETIKVFLEYKQRNSSNFQLIEPVAPLFEGETLDKAVSVKEVLNRLTINLLDATKTLKTTENILQKESINAKETEIYSFLMQMKSNFQGEMFDIDILNKEEKEFWVNLDTDAFGDAIKNLVNNAQKHGFAPNKCHHILFELGTTYDNEGIIYVKIDYKNDGKPFPKDFTFEEFKRLTGRAGKNKGTGLGGYFINKVIQLHKGYFYSKGNSYDSSYNIHFEILIPLIKQEI